MTESDYSPPASTGSSGFPKVVDSGVEVTLVAGELVTIATYTVGENDGLFEVGGMLNVLDSNAVPSWVEVDFTDQDGNVWSNANGNGWVLYDSTLAQNTQSPVSGAGESQGGAWPLIPFSFVAKAGTVITVVGVGGSQHPPGSFHADASAWIEQKA